MRKKSWKDQVCLQIIFDIVSEDISYYKGEKNKAKMSQQNQIPILLLFRGRKEWLFNTHN